MFINLRIAAVLLTIAPLVACNSSVAASQEQSPAESLLEIAFPEQLVVEQNVASFHEILLKRFDETSAFVARAKSEPTLRQRFLVEANKLIENDIRQSLPSLRQKCIKLYNETFTPQEIRYLVAFYNTPTGQKLSRRLISGSAKSGGGTWQEVRQDGKNNAAASLDRTDRPELERLMQSSAFPKLKMIGPKISELSAAHFDQMNDKLTADLKLFISQY